MERLTTDKPVSEMNMTELTYNSCFAKNGEAYYRDFTEEISARDFARKLYRRYAGEELSENDDTFDEEMIGELQFDVEIYPETLVALFYRNLWAMADLRETLKRYEDEEEQGFLLRLPCKTGDTVYVNYIGQTTIATVSSISINSYGITAMLYIDPDIYEEYDIEDIYRSESEAEQALIDTMEN